MKMKKKVNWENDIRLFGEYLRERENSAATIEKYLRDVRTFREYLEDREILDKNCLLQYKEWLSANYSVSSVNSMLVALNQFLVFLEAGSMKVRRVKVQPQRFRAAERKDISTTPIRFWCWKVITQKQKHILTKLIVIGQTG